jgi:hypothetical protein
MTEARNIKEGEGICGNAYDHRKRVKLMVPKRLRGLSYAI